MSKVSIQHILFDLGNVLVEIHPEETIATLAGHCACPAAEVQEFFLSEPHLRFMAGEISPDQFYEIFQGTYRCSLSFIQFSEIWNQLIGAPKPDMAGLIGSLSGRYVLSLLSNTDPLHWEVAKKRCEFLTAFRNYFLSFQLGCVKPSQRIFAAVLKKLQTSAEKCLFIDDTPENIRVAEKLGFAAVCAHTADEIVAGLKKYEIFEHFS